MIASLGRTGVHIVGLITLLISEHATQLKALTEGYAVIAASSVRWQTDGPLSRSLAPARWFTLPVSGHFRVLLVAVTDASELLSGVIELKLS